MRKSRERLILDRSGLGHVPEGYRIITSEADFLRTALHKDRQVVRGEALCRWAESFWRSRGWAYEEIRSPIDDLLSACPGLDDSQAEAVLQALGERFWSLPTPFSVLELLKLAVPGGPWDRDPSPEHAARWLVWLEEANIPEHIEPLIRHQAAIWEAESEAGYRRVYAITDPSESAILLAIWIGLEEGDGSDDLGVFPIGVPERWQQKAREKWKREVVSAGPAVFEAVPASRLPRRIKETAAEEVSTYCIHHPEKLSVDLIYALEPFLSTERVNELRCILPPEPPGASPQQVEALEEWFVNRYLPYREWQVKNLDANVTETVHKIAADFGKWYLDSYPIALSGGPGKEYLAMRRSEALRTAGRGEVRLWVILDGLHFGDARKLSREIGELEPKIREDQVSIALAAIPTITKFAKPALVTSLPPVQAEIASVSDGSGPTVMPENRDPCPVLREAQKGDTFLWCHSEPDKTYHKLTDRSMIVDNVYGVMKSLASKITSAAKAVPENLPLRIVLSTDHGRLLGGGKRTHSVPSGMQAESRAAYGVSGASFDDSGLKVLEDEQVVVVHAGRYGLPADCAVVLDEDSFVTNDGKSGVEHFPHGGLYPEEVIVPWIELTRARALPSVEGVVSGKARPTFDELVLVHIRNLSENRLTVSTLTISIAAKKSHEVPLDCDIDPYSECKIEAMLRGWPTHEQIRQSVARLGCKMDDGTEFESEVRLELEAEQMYKQETTLEDLL